MYCNLSVILWPAFPISCAITLSSVSSSPIVPEKQAAVNSKGNLLPQLKRNPIYFNNNGTFKIVHFTDL